jgi:hypothetical protein
MHLTYTSIKDVHATGEAFSSRKGTSSNSKDEIMSFFPFFWVIFSLLDPDPDFESGSGDPI